MIPILQFSGTEALIFRNMIYAKSYVSHCVAKDEIPNLPNPQHVRKKEQYLPLNPAVGHSRIRTLTPGIPSDQAFSPCRGDSSISPVSKPLPRTRDTPLSGIFGVLHLLFGATSCHVDEASEKNRKPDHIFPTPPIHRVHCYPWPLGALDMGGPARRFFPQELFG
jgi:hypothetical protein